MPLQNRVDPWGKLNAVSQYGTLLGNRGRLHDDRKLIKQFAGKAWITCILGGESGRGKVFGPSGYSELFFLDEATAFASGHRPCAQCRRPRYNDFKTAWIEANRENFEKARPAIADIDAVLHRERIADGEKVTYPAPIGSLPIGSMFDLGGRAYLVDGECIKKWSFSGYIDAEAPSPETIVSVLTPKSIVTMFARGFQPEIGH